MKNFKITKDLSKVIEISFEQQLNDINITLEYAQNVIRVSSGLNMLPMDLSITIKYAESELKKSSNRAIINRYRKQNQNIFALLPDFCDSIVSERIIDDASDPNVVKQMRDLVELGRMAGVIQ